MRLVADEGRLDAEGAWRGGSRRQQTKLDVALDVKDAAGFLTRFGFPNAVQGAPTKITGQLAWAGAPNGLDYPTLTGTFRVDVGPGRFTKVEPGIGKLLGVLSLQALPRRITLDFRDIFSEGFTFDQINGTVRVDRGILTTDNLRLLGPAAKVEITGDADLAQETQRLHVRVQPTLSAGVSAGAALLFLANPGRGRGRRRGIAAGPEDAAGPDRADVQLRLRRDRELVRSDRHPRREYQRRRTGGQRAGNERENFRVAAVQMVSTGRVADNLAQAAALVDTAAGEGARLVVLPEYFGIMGAHASDKLAVREVDGDGPQQAFLAQSAQRHGVWLVGGSVPIAGGDPGRVRSACLVYGPDGRRVARYDKIHLFAFAQGDESYDEARTIEPGEAPMTFDLPCGRVGLSICYDLRFPELYRALGELALILVPAAFTATTGVAHWHLLLRARAVENQCYVLAAAQGGRARRRPQHFRPFGADRPVGAGGRRTPGRSGDRGRRRRAFAHRRRARAPAGSGPSQIALAHRCRGAISRP